MNDYFLRQFLSKHIYNTVQRFTRTSFQINLKKLDSVVDLYSPIIEKVILAHFMRAELKTGALYFVDGSLINNYCIVVTCKLQAK